MRRALVSTLAAGLAVCLWSGTAFAGSVTVRNDPDDSASVLDINKVGTDTSNRNAFFGIRTWDPFLSTDVTQPNQFFVFLLDTKRRGRYDKLVYLSYDPGQARYECEVHNRGNNIPRGIRGAQRSDNKDIHCVIPVRWLDIHKPVQFGVEAWDNGNLKDRAPNNRRYVGL